jgi:hypothetical protein
LKFDNVFPFNKLTHAKDMLKCHELTQTATMPTGEIIAPSLIFSGLELNKYPKNKGTLQIEYVALQPVTSTIVEVEASSVVGYVPRKEPSKIVRKGF